MSNDRSLLDCNWLDLEKLRNKSVLITGGTGLIGFNLIKELCKVSDGLHIKILALVRDKDRALKQFKTCASKIEFVVGDVMNLPEFDHKINYIIHGASITASRMFVENPVETILTAVEGTRNMLELAVKKNVDSMVYLSSMEVYGALQEKTLLTEDRLGYINPLHVRSSYSESKRMCENLCVAYMSEYGVNVKIARLAQTFGPGIPKNDQRVFVQFLRKALNHEDIEIKTSGRSSRMYIYTYDAVTAILSIALNGANGIAYNVANKDTYCSIYELAQLIAHHFGTQSKVLVNTGSEEERRIYPPDSYLLLDTANLESLGWNPQYPLEEGLRNLVNAMEEAE